MLNYIHDTSSVNINLANINSTAFIPHFTKCRCGQSGKEDNPIARRSVNRLVYRNNFNLLRILGSYRGWQTEKNVGRRWCGICFDFDLLALHWKGRISQNWRCNYINRCTDKFVICLRYCRLSLICET